MSVWPVRRNKFITSVRSALLNYINAISRGGSMLSKTNSELSRASLLNWKSPTLSFFSSFVLSLTISHVFLIYPLASTSSTLKCLITASGYLMSISSRIFSLASIMSFSRFASKIAKACCYSASPSISVKNFLIYISWFLSFIPMATLSSSSFFFSSVMDVNLSYLDRFRPKLIWFPPIVNIFFTSGLLSGLTSSTSMIF